MLISLKWLKELLPNLKATPASLEKRLSAAGVEVESVLHQKDTLTGVLVGEVRSVEPHPNADKLNVTSVWDGAELHTVVCGAPNVQAGQRVAFAPVGVKLPNGLLLESRAIRGVMSSGMICSEAELGISAANEGILVLKPRSKPGRALAEVLELDDVFFELSITPNRPDLLSHFGIARELAALYQLPAPKVSVRVREASKAASDLAKVEIKDTKRCPKYVARVISGVRVGPSAPWIQRRLKNLGIRSISNVVDATNLVLLELGHPLHAFDLAKLRGARIVVRTPAEGEVIRTLDDQVRTLASDDLVIADAESPVALAGVMGGAESEVGEDTQTILLESAFFQPSTVRKTSKRHGLHTEASHRFERGADIAMAEHAVDRCAALIVELAGGHVLKGRLAVGRREKSSAPVGVRPERASRLIGRPITREEARSTLTLLGLKPVRKPAEKKTKAKGKAKKKHAGASPLVSWSDALFFEVPSHRIDLEREEDLIEEIARVAGYDTIPTVMPALSSGGLFTASVRIPAERRARRAMVEAGFFEAISLAFSASSQVESLGLSVDSAVVIANPLGEETQLMRPSLVPALLKAARTNQDNLPSVTDLRLFEVGKTFAWADPSAELPRERTRLTWIMRGLRSPAGWGSAKDLTDIFDMKAVVERMLDAFRIRGHVFRVDDTPWLHPTSATRIEHEGEVLGVFGEAHPDVLGRFGLEGAPVFVADLDLDVLDARAGGLAKFGGLPKFPPAQRDLSFFVQKAVTSESVLNAIHGAGTRMLESVELFDVYAGRGVPEGQKSLAVSLVFRVADRTLTDREVDEAQAVVVSAVLALGAQLRANPS
ncbi:MAG: phenylalanine--tRNA ligase subunit beta [Deltaproteobacteria bacterium]|nr:phenylalanine--tRNA ligase subunit beta [Deltaproteobacteria bacterium]